MSGDFILGILVSLGFALTCAILWGVLSLLWDHLTDKMRWATSCAEQSAAQANRGVDALDERVDKIRARVAVIEKKLRIKPK